MTVDKRMKYEMQGGSKPARNYLGTQKTVSGIPVKWKSGPDAPSTELAYITKAEKDLLLKKNLHGSLKNGPNTGPDEIMSLDSQGDYTRDRSPSRAEGSQAAGVGGGNSAYMNQQIQKAHDAQMKALLTGNVTKGETVAKGPRTRQYSNLPEYMKVGGKNKYIGSAYKSYGQPSFFGNLFSRGAPGYRGIKGLPAWGNPMKNINRSGTITPQGNIVGGEYYSDKENFGETRDAVPFGIMGLIQRLANKFKKPPQDMSEYNKLQLVDSDGTFTGPSTTKKGSSEYNDMIPGLETKFVNQNAPGPWNNFNKPTSNLDQSPAGDNYEWYNPTTWDLKNNPAANFGETVYDLTQGENAPPDNPDKWQLAREIWPTYKQGLVDAGVEEWGADFQEDVQNQGGITAALADRLKNLNTVGDAFKGWENIGQGFADESVMRTNPIYQYGQNIGETYPNLFSPSKWKDGGRVGYADGGLATLFARRG